MGVYLSTPKTDKTTEEGENEDLLFGASAMQGWRQDMEDAHISILDVDTNTSIFGIFDGHGGEVVSKFCAKYLHKEVMKSEAYARGDLGASLEHAFLRMDEMMKGERGWRELQILRKEGGKTVWKREGHGPSNAARETDRDEGCITNAATESNNENWTEEEGPHSSYLGPASSGSTAVVALIRGNQLVVANAGDSRCIMSRHGKALDLSIDHKPELELEKGRILLAGGFIHAGRVNGSLNLTRAIGDMDFKYQTELPPDKQVVTCCPDLQHVELGPGDEFLVLGCDGIWDVKSSQEVVNFVRERLPTAKSLSSLCEELLDNCLAPTTKGEGCDNMSIIIVQLKKFEGVPSTPTNQRS